MTITIPVIFSTKDEGYLCFRHAVARALDGASVTVEADSSVEENDYFGPMSCVACGEESRTKTRENELLEQLTRLLASYRTLPEYEPGVAKTTATVIAKYKEKQ